ncbi:hypothetical protein Btru_000472 [Bulinus truncatus]|nr:hypothetical protein Btru_000472 [Bulinus truncatus]
MLCIKCHVHWLVGRNTGVTDGDKYLMLGRPQNVWPATHLIRRRTVHWGQKVIRHNQVGAGSLPESRMVHRESTLGAVVFVGAHSSLP